MNSDEPPSQPHIAAVILTSGLSTQRRSRTPKERQPLAGCRLIDDVLRAVHRTHPAQIIIVLSPTKAEMAESLPEGRAVACQRKPLGTGLDGHPRIGNYAEIKHAVRGTGDTRGPFQLYWGCRRGRQADRSGADLDRPAQRVHAWHGPDETVVGIPAGPVSKRMRSARAGSENES